MWRLLLLVTVLAPTLLAAGTITFSCQASTGCRCSYAGSSTDVTCTSLSAVSKLPPLVRRLDLSRNDIVSLAGDLFVHLVILEELILAWDRMSYISEYAFHNVTNLRTLDLSHNLLSSIPPGILDYVPRLQKLDLSFNRLTSLDVATFCNVPNLDELSLSYNDRLGPFLMSSPEALSVAFKNDLRTLYLDHVNMEYISDSFFVDAESLRELSLADNPLQMIPFFPGGLDTLDMSGTDLDIIFPGSFIELPFLRVLRMDRLRKLTEVHMNAFEGLTSLEELSMKACVKLRMFDGKAFGLGSLQRCEVKWLSLAMGGLTTLPEELIEPLSAMERVDLQDNPWDCDCNLAWMLRLNLSASEIADLRCAAPSHLRNTLVLSLAKTSFRCSSHHKRRLVVAIAGTALLLFGAAMVGVLLWRHLMRERKGAVVRTPGAYEMLRMNSAAGDDDEDEVVVGVWRTENSGR